MEKNPGWCRLCTWFIAKGQGQGGKPTRSQLLAAPPQIIADVPFLYTAEEQAHMGRLLYGEADSIPHEEEGGGWDMLDRGCGMQEEGICWTGDAECGRWRRLECDLCL